MFREVQLHFGKRRHLTRSLSHDRPARKRYFSLPQSGHESTTPRGHISSVPSRSGGHDRLVLPSLLWVVIIYIIQDITNEASAFTTASYFGHQVSMIVFRANVSRGSGGKMTIFSNGSYDQSELPNPIIYSPI